MVGPSKNMLTRLTVLVTLLLICLVIIVPVALVDKQIIDYELYQEKAINQQTRDKIIEPARGTIYDSNMKELAVSANVEQIIAEPIIIESEEQDTALIAEGLSRILGIDYEKTKKKLEKENSKYESIKSEVEKKEADLIREFIRENNIEGIYIQPDTKRYYPQGNLASNLIGFTGTEGYGLWGIEQYYDETLSGTPGRIISAKDGGGNEMPFEYEQLIEPEDGSSLVLTIDEVIQYFLEKHLETARNDSQPLEGVSGIIMNVKTGEILAMATKPDYDPNNPFEVTDPVLALKLEGLVGEELKEAKTAMWKNKPVTDSYEPGSTFKIFTMAMAIEEGLVDENTMFHCPGYRIIAGTRIHCHKRTGHGTQTLSKALENSCNPAMMDLGGMIGNEKFMEYFEAFGFTEKTGVGLGGEESGLFHSKANFNEVELAVSSFGQTFQVTPLQMLTATSAIVNDGNLVKPHVIKEVIDKDGKIIETTSVEPISQIVSQKTSDFMCEALERVVTTGTARNAYVKGYRVGGKTATSEKIQKNLETGEEYRIASFIGVAPMDDPQVAVLIMIDEPQGEFKGGGQLAAPVVGRIMADILPYLGVTPEYTEEELASIDIVVPNTIGMTKDEAITHLKNQKIPSRVVGEGDVVTDQVPAPSSKAPSSASVILYMGGTKPTKSITVPNIKGKSATQTKKILEDAGLYLRATGTSAKVSGTVQTTASKQSPKAGTEVSIGTVINVEFTDNINVSD